MSKFINAPLPKDLPENWTETQYVSPGGTEVGLTERHGYNYLMKQVNNAQKAASELGAGLDLMVGVNLLDNWYFVDPLSRVVAKYVVAGAKYYRDTAFSSVVNSVAYAQPVATVTDAYGTINVGNNTYYVKLEDLRDGYAATGTRKYILERWIGHSCVIQQDAAGVVLFYNNERTDVRGYLSQYIVTPKKLAGKTITVSVLVNSLSGGTGQLEIQGETAIDASYPQSYLNKSLKEGMNVFTTKLFESVGGNSYPYLLIEIATPPGGSMSIAAIKLELGPYQTLAHQDESGAWILNEIPNKGLETVKCNCAPVELGGIGMIVAPEDIGATTANTFANVEVVE